ncbi:restriction endonuclease subunit S [uncultured Chryseobacterium sp.]|uniref:restriction endonuclease subunit S n=1 Tax=uncultured Chryseobacterium sp. TaxID=259322 RepID=UPI0025F319EF|nr:restriction endonuclease subunit S [uncultured Chryseobacterium sp.]
MESTKPTGSSFRYIDIDAINNKKHKVTKPKTVKIEDTPSRATRKLSTGDTLFSMVRPYLKNIAFIDKSLDDCIASTGFYVCKPNKMLFPEFCFNLMTSKYIIDGLNSFMKGDNSPSINNENILNWLYPIPPLEEQIKIVHNIKRLYRFIDELEMNQIDLQKAVNQTKSKILDLAIRGKLVPQDPNDEPASVLFERIKSEHPKSKKKTKNTGDNSHYQNLPQGWTECTLESIGSWSSGATPNRSNKMYYENGTISWLKTGDLNDSDIDYIPEKITDLALKECSVRLNPKGSVLIAMYGATIGKIGILNIPAATNQACCTCITYSGIYNKFLFYLLMAKKKILQMKAEGGAQPNISKEKITNFPILLPPSREQIRIVQAIENLFQRLDNITAGL